MKTKAQSTIEFTFAIIAIMFFMYGMVRVFRWVGMDMAERRYAAEKVITTGSSPLEQLSPTEFYRPKRIAPVFINGM